MFMLPDRFPRLITMTALAILAASCSDDATGPASRDIHARHDVTLPAGYIIDTGPGGTSSVGSAALFSAGSTTCLPQPACAGHFQFLGGKFTMAHGANIQSVEGWMSIGVAGSMDVHIRSDSTPPAGAHIPGHSLDSVRYAVGTQVYGWKVFSSTAVTLPAGTYWLTFEPVPNTALNGGMTGTAASPLADYAFFADGNNRWVPYSVFSQNPAFGFRVYGESVLTASDLIVDLRAYVAGSGIPRPNIMKIDGSLQKAATALAANNVITACANLQDVLDYLARQSVRKIPASVSTEIVSQTNVIRTDIGC